MSYWALKRLSMLIKECEHACSVVTDSENRTKLEYLTAVLNRLNDQYRSSSTNVAFTDSFEVFEQVVRDELTRLTGTSEFKHYRIADLDLPIQVVNSLRSRKIMFTDELTALSADQIDAIRNIGRTSIRYIIAAYEKQGLECPPGWKDYVA